MVNLANPPASLSSVVAGVPTGFMGKFKPVTQAGEVQSVDDLKELVPDSVRPVVNKLFAARPDIAALIQGSHTLCPAWSELFVHSYDMKREELPGEIEFWCDLARGASTVLEIGSGTGYISQHLAQLGLGSLVLVEPERVNLARLANRMAAISTDTRVSIVPGLFQEYRGEPLDLIMFPYDSLPMVYQKADRAKIFQHMARNLKTGGRFGVHISSAEWNEGYIAEHKDPVTEIFPKVDGWPAFSRTRQVIPVSDELYFNKMEVVLLSGAIYERFLDPVVIVSPEEVIGMARDNGLILEVQYEDFPAHEPAGSDDHIFVFKKA